MRRNVLLKTLWDQRRSFLWWSVGLVALAAVYIAFYPSVRDAPELEQYMEQLPEEILALFGGQFVDYTSPEGYLSAEVFFFMAPLLFMIFALAAGSGAIAGEEEQGTLALLLSAPINRYRVTLEKFGALIIATFLLGVVFWAALSIGAVSISMDISIWRIAEATLSTALLGALYGTVALVFGCATGKRSLSLSVAGAFGVAAYFLNALAPVVDLLEPYQKLSPFYYYIGNDPIINGLNPLHVMALVGLILALLPVALFAFERRDLAT